MIRTALIFILSMMPLGGLATAAVHVNRQPPVIERKTFDPANPPPQMPHLNPGEAAVTTSDFTCQTKADYEVISRTPSPDGVTSLVSVHGITISTQLHIVVYVPNGASEKLIAHEEGHRKLAEKIYNEQAFRAARAAGAQVDGHRFSGEGPDWTTAAQSAVNPALRATGERYLELTAKYSIETNETYDALTRHGTNVKPEDTAIAEALAKYEKDHPTTRPAKPK